MTTIVATIRATTVNNTTMRFIYASPPFPGNGAGLLSPTEFYNATTLASMGTRRITQLQYLLQLSSPTSENSVKAKFRESPFHALR
jgi:hypothetical protein